MFILLPKVNQSSAQILLVQTPTYYFFVVVEIIIFNEVIYWLGLGKFLFGTGELLNVDFHRDQLLCL